MSEETETPKSVDVAGRFDGLVGRLSTPEEIEMFAMKGNHTLLWHCVQMYKSGKYTWEQTMQVAAFSQAETIAILNKQLFDCIDGEPASGMVANAALEGRGD